MVAIGFGDLQDLQGLQVPREQRAIKVTLALQVQQGRSAQQARKVPRDPLDLLDLPDLGGPRDLLVLLEIQQRHPGASNFVGAGGNRCLMSAFPEDGPELERWLLNHRAQAPGIIPGALKLLFEQPSRNHDDDLGCWRPNDARTMPHASSLSQVVAASAARSILSML